MTKETVHHLAWDTGEGVTHTVFVRELTGEGSGPVLVLIAGEHGIELAGPAGIDLVCRELLERRFAGTVLAVPSIAPCNIQYRSHTHGQPRGQGYTCDMPYNTWAKWPGKPDGDPAQRLCHRVWSEVVARGDVVFNFHTWSRNSAGCLFTDERVPGMRDLAAAFGNTFNQLRDDHGGDCLHACLLRDGRRAALVEMQGQWRIEPDSLARVRDGITNLMAALGMLRQPLAQPRPQFAIGGEATVTAPSAGLFVPLKPVEQRVRKDELVGYLLDVNTGARTDIVSPIDGAVWLVARTGAAADVRLEGLHAYADTGDLLVLIKEVTPLV